MSDVDVALDATADSIPLAREALDTLREEVGQDRLDDLRLVVSELVTNSVRHAGLRTGDSISLRVDALADHIRVEIQDRGPGFEASATPATMYQESGWGLYLVSQIAERWGVSTDATGTTVWLEIAR